MPVIHEREGGISELHIAARLQIELPQSESLTDMQMQIYFWVQTQLNGVAIAPTYWDSQLLIIKVADDERLLNAVRTIQQILGEKRYAQLTAPPSEATEPIN